jgi:preprotein translocase subunit SecG
MQELVLIIHILAATCLVCLVLIQHGKGADMGAGFGSGASGTMFGSSGSIPFLIKVTTLIAVIFFVTSVLLGVMVAKQTKLSYEQQIPTVPVMPSETA